MKDVLGLICSLEAPEVRAFLLVVVILGYILFGICVCGVWSHREQNGENQRNPTFHLDLDPPPTKFITNDALPTLPPKVTPENQEKDQEKKDVQPKKRVLRTQRDKFTYHYIPNIEAQPLCTQVEWQLPSTTKSLRYVSVIRFKNAGFEIRNILQVHDVFTFVSQIQSALALGGVSETISFQVIRQRIPQGGGCLEHNGTHLGGTSKTY